MLGTWWSLFLPVPCSLLLLFFPLLRSYTVFLLLRYQMASVKGIFCSLVKFTSLVKIPCHWIRSKRCRLAWVIATLGKDCHTNDATPPKNCHAKRLASAAAKKKTKVELYILKICRMFWCGRSHVDCSPNLAKFIMCFFWGGGGE